MTKSRKLPTGGLFYCSFTCGFEMGARGVAAQICGVVHNAAAADRPRVGRTPLPTHRCLCTRGLELNTTIGNSVSKGARAPTFRGRGIALHPCRWLAGLFCGGTPGYARACAHQGGTWAGFMDEGARDQGRKPVRLATAKHGSALVPYCSTLEATTSAVKSPARPQISARGGGRPPRNKARHGTSRHSTR